MSRKVELKLQRRKFIQSGQEEKAHQVLKEYWNFCGKESVEHKEEAEEIELENYREYVETEEKVNFLEELVKIKGIGKETAKDIKKIYKNMSNLLMALNSGKVLPLRNDVERKLKKEFI